MYEAFFNAFQTKVALSREEQLQIQQYLVLKKLRRRQYLLQQGEVCTAYALVAKGSMRVYSVDEAGTEHTLQFGIEGWILADTYSFLTGEASAYNIEALEHVELVLVSREAHEELLRTSPRYETFTRLNLTGAYIALQRRLLATNSATSEQRYTAFITHYPQIATRVPQHLIASYLGLTPATLSRVRKRLMADK